MVAAEALEQAPVSDQDLIQRVENGDEEAFNILYDRYYPRVYRFVKRRLRNRMVKSHMKTTLRRLHEAPGRDSAEEAMPSVYSVLDRASKQGAIPKRTADRRKSRLMRRLNRQS